MKSLTYYPSKTGICDRQLHIESNSGLNYRAEIPESGTHLSIFDGKQLIGQVDGTYIVLFGKTIEQKKLGWCSWAWVLHDSPQQLLRPEGDSYLLDGLVVANVTDKLAVIDSYDLFEIFNLFKKRNLSERFLKLDYDEKKIDDMTAFCLLLVKVSKTFHTI